MALYNYLSIINNYNAIDYMRETMLLSGCLLLLILILYLISTHYIKNNVINEKLIFLPLEKVEIDEKNLKKNLSSNNKSKNNNTRYILIEKKELLNKVPARTRCGAESLVIKNSSQVGLKKLWNMNIQSAENFKGFSETIRQYDNLENNTNTLLKVKNSLNEKKRTLSIKENKKRISDGKFWAYLAGIMDGDGYFQIRTINGKRNLVSIEVKVHNRDLRILTRILDKTHKGRIYNYKSDPYSKWKVSTKEEMKYIVKKLNGLIRLRANYLKECCEIYNLEYKEADYNIKENDSYLSGLVDSDGSIVLNYTGNRIECNLEIKYNEYSEKLNLDNVILNYIPNTIIVKKKVGKGSNIMIKEYKRYSYQTVRGMMWLYEYFMKNRLYSDFKFFRVSKIKKFIEIRQFNKSSYESEEFFIYSKFLLEFIEYLNPKWTKIPFVSKLRHKR